MVGSNVDDGDNDGVIFAVYMHINLFLLFWRDSRVNKFGKWNSFYVEFRLLCTNFHVVSLLTGSLSNCPLP